MKIIWTRLALDDLENAYEFITEANPKAADQIVDRVEKALFNLKIYPNVGRKGRIDGTRELVIPNTPFILPYKIKGNCSALP